MRSNAALTVLSVFAVLFLLVPLGFAHRGRPVAPAPHGRYQALASKGSTQTAHWVRGAEKHRRGIEGRERAVRGRGAVRGAVRTQSTKHRVAAVGRTGRLGNPIHAAARPTVSLGVHDVAVSVPVVSVIRQSGDHPQLEGVEVAAGRTEILPDLYDERGRLNRIPALKGSHEILLRQNQMASLDGLTRVADDDDLAKMRDAKALVPIPVNGGLRVDERLEDNRRYCRPWAAQFLVAIGAAHYGEFHRPLQVNSAVRTVSFQLKLIRHNGNAAQAEGDAASPHLTGQAIDLAKKGLSEAEIAWMRLYLARLVEEGRIDVEEEFKQACFHVSIYKKYAPGGPAQRIMATHREMTPSLAATLE